MEMRMRGRVFFLLLGVFAALQCVRADSPAVTAVLTSSETEVEHAVQLQIKVTGGSSATPPNDIDVDGLDIRYAGESQLVEGRNFRFTYSFVYNYTILPLRAGTFTIPPLTVQTNNGPLRTPALTLHVTANDQTTTGRGRNSGALDSRQLAFAELIVPQKSAYLGEMVPVEIRMGISTRVRHGFKPGVSLGGQGFTTQKLQNPEQSIETRNGQSYETVTFKTAIAAARTGKLTLDITDAVGVVQVPARGGSRSRSPADLFGMDDPFSDPFFDQFTGRVEQRELNLTATPVTLEVKPLPAKAPPGFSGAVGVFNLTAEVKPKSVQVGDPLTVTANISGRGNFDRVTAPTLEDEHGWHTYPPSSNFKPDDDIGMSGTKSFEMVLTPNERKDAVPPIVFTYFDPLKEGYVTLRSDKLPVLVEGGAAPTAAPALASSSVVPKSAAPAPPAPDTKAPDILYQLTDRGRLGQDFAPVFMRPVFWAAQAVPMLGLIGFFGWTARKRRLDNREMQKRAGWEHETNELQKKLRRGDDPPDQYFAEALRLVQLKTALASPSRRVEPNTVDAESAVAAFQLSDEKRDRVRELFRRSDELRYSGRGNGDGAVAEQTRREVLELIESLS
jgi:hypothetical protein